MATDFTFTLENRPGSGARVLEALGKAGANIIGACALPTGGETTVHLAFEDASGVRAALQEAGATVSDEREVVLTDVEDRPGAGGRLLRRLAEAGINVDYLYLATGSRLVLGVSDAARAADALKG